MTDTSASSQRLDYLDAVRAFALLLGIVFHAGLSFLPIFIGWAVMDVSTSPVVSMFGLVSHSFRMGLFFLIAGFFSHLAFHRKGGTEFLKGRFLRIVVPFVIGWFALRPLLVSGWVMGNASLRGDFDIGAGLAAGFRSLSSLPEGIFAGTHLWFLYYLALITTAFLCVRAMATINPWLRDGLARISDTAIERLARSRLAVLLPAVPTAACLWFMRNWGMDTPDQSLVPSLPVLTIYGGCFSIGWALHRNEKWLTSLSRLSAVRALVAIGATVAAILLSSIQGTPGHPHYQLARVGFVSAYGVMMWSLIFLTIGVPRVMIRKPNALVRYVADSSYWLYLAHLPVVIWLQIAFAELPLHWMLKLASITGLTIAVSLLVYDVLVRPTFAGALLNGRRKPSMLLRWMPWPQRKSCSSPVIISRSRLTRERDPETAR